MIYQPKTSVAFAADIKPLFRTRDINAMKNFGGFDLSKYDDVVSHADSILARLKAGDMPCDQAWDPAKIALFEQWMAEGKVA
jgi:hypothetical protein